jgi:hypothetical protein
VFQVRVEERAPPPQPKGLKLKLSREGEREAQRLELVHPPDGSFGELLAAYCAQAGLQAAGSACQYPNGVTPLLPVSDRTAGRIPNKGGTKAISLPSTASLIASMRGYTRAV